MLNVPALKSTEKNIMFDIFSVDVKMSITEIKITL
jgi:hypothetical protein